MSGTPAMGAPRPGARASVALSVETTQATTRAREPRDGHAARACPTTKWSRRRPPGWLDPPVRHAHRRCGCRRRGSTWIRSAGREQQVAMKKQKVPGFSACMKMMRKHDAQIKEDGFHFLLPRAAEFCVELLREFQLETDHGLRCWLLELLGAAVDERALGLFVEQLHSEDESFRYWAILGLRKLDTYEARSALFDAGVPKVPPAHTSVNRRDKRGQ